MFFYPRHDKYEQSMEVVAVGRWCWVFLSAGVLLIWIIVGQGPTVLAVGAMGFRSPVRICRRAVALLPASY